MSKIFLFIFLTVILGNPFIAILILLIILYLLDRRFVGLSPSLIKPLKRGGRISKLRQQIALNTSDVSAVHELARLRLEGRGAKEAKELLLRIQAMKSDSAEYWDDLGVALLRTGDEAAAEQAWRQALQLNPRVKYGQPHLRLASLYSEREPEQAIHHLNAFREVHSSSCEAYYRLGLLYRKLGRTTEARAAFAEARALYSALPKYKKRQERRWALLSLLQGR